MSANDLLYNDFNCETQRGEANTFNTVRGDLKKDAHSKIWTFVVAHFEGLKVFDEKFSMNDLEGKKIYSGGTKGNWLSRYINGTGVGKIIGKATNNYESTVENIASSIIVHEWYSHIKKNYGTDTKDHRFAYKNVIDYKYLWNKTTLDYKEFNLKKLFKFTKNETKKEVNDLNYIKLYNEYVNK